MGLIEVFTEDKGQTVTQIKAQMKREPINELCEITPSVSGIRIYETISFE